MDITSEAPARQSYPEVFHKKMVLQNFEKFTECRRLFFIQLQAHSLEFHQKETLKHVFSAEFIEI